jgi:hypothetical protein
LVNFRELGVVSLREKTPRCRLRKVSKGTSYVFAVARRDGI